MARYIDADKLVERLKVSPKLKGFNTSGYFIRDIVIDLVECQQTADVVEVVRCKDCRHGSKCTDGYYTCRVDHRLAHDEDDFCSYGERKE